MTMPAKCTACRQHRCDDCFTLGLYCECCGKIWDSADDPNIEFVDRSD